MYFYEMEYEADKSFETKTRDQQRVANERFGRGVTYLNGKISKTIRFDISQTSNSSLILAVAVKDDNKDDYVAMASEFVQKLKITARLLESKEITIERYIRLIINSDRNDFIRDDRIVFSELNISRMCEYEGDSRLKEEMVDEIPSKEKAIENVQKMLCVPDLLPEVERIFAETNQKQFLAHPVQYVVMADDDDLKKDIRKILVGSLYKTGRLPSRRICFVGTNTGRRDDLELDADVAEALYDAQRGSTLIFQPVASSMVGGARNKNYETLQRVCKRIQKYHANTLNIIELSRSDERTLEQIQAELPDMKFIVFKETMIFTKVAKRYLKAKAKADGIKDCASLIALLPEDEKGFYPNDLNKMYSKWFDNRLCTEVYPQYNNIAVKSGSLKAKPKGDAYQQLEELIGLDAAKKVIRNAIDYNKAQKLFEENGMHTESCARHMVFTGNPGSAKTTVARLFAQIMKDNKLLAEGNLIETGRADIVDEYLGGTAPRVQRLFKRAVGNVLFIDEAYSLVDGERGLYGDEAINAIVQEMENHRDDTVVIFAGYPDKMKSFLNSNPGLRSRIAFHINFDDYTEDELYQILQLFAKENGMILDSEVESKVRPIFREALKHPDFGNGRFVRNVFEQATMRQASRLVNLKTDVINKDVLSKLLASDFEAPENYTSDDSYKAIGFAS